MQSSYPRAALPPLALSTNDSKNKSKHFVAGALGGMTAAVLTCPLDVVRTRLQAAVHNNRTVRSQTTLGTMRSIAARESIFGLWRGITPTLVAIAPTRAIHFGTYSEFKKILASRGFEGKLSNFTAASGAGCVATTLLCPVWVVKTRLQLLPTHAKQPVRGDVLSLGMANGGEAATKVAQKQMTSIKHVVKEMYQKEGARVFFRGLSASYWGISESAIQLMLYEETKQRMQNPSQMNMFLAAGGCKMVASVLTYPHEVVRTRIRDQREYVGSTAEVKYKRMIPSIIRIAREEGVRALYGGMEAHLLRTVPNAAVMFAVVELVSGL